ncbi:WSC-domain-containing protein [Coniochaeta ligniaria NRRL 30616]|uniref:WSC-domain-containing protein n=1 Tax=Coniochaeta ligniaria NRRL 30616 TaxID=1408157 RepID=A0A1J7IZY6_9PEZI|nr:WSC-domain-containing protein [Coniochaeta ligniaria NRRL 30616]
MFVKNGATLVAALSLLASVDAKRQQLHERGTRCNGDNLLNRFRDHRYSDAAVSFCQTFINSVTYSVVTVSTDAAHVSSPVTAYSTAYPSPLLTASYPASRLSSACSCVTLPAVTAVVTEYVASSTSVASDDAATTTSDDPSTITDDPSTTSTDDSTTTTEDPTTSTEEPTTSTEDPATSTDDATTTATDDPSTTSTDDASTSTEDPSTTSTEEPSTTSTDDASTTTDDASTTATEDASTTTDDSTTTTEDPSTTSTDDPATTTTDDSSTTTDDASATTTEDPSATPTDPATTTTDAPAGPTSLGCYVEGAGGRALKNLILADDTLTVESCAAACTNYAFYGVEYGRECWCDDVIESTAFLSPDASVCDMACKGDATETCGGSSTINIYGAAPADTTTPTESPYTFTGCFAEPDGARALPQLYASTKMTIELCHLDCSLAGYTYAGLEYSTECWCGNSIPELVALGPESCSTACAGDATETCGGNNALQLYTATSTGTAN